MRPVNAIVVCAGLVFCLATPSARADDAFPLNVSVNPVVPTIFDPITIHASGTDGWAVRVVDSHYRDTTLMLELDVTLQSGRVPVVTKWKLDQPIGTLPEGSYDLLMTVAYADEPFTRQVRTSFRVVPEPSAIGLLLGTTMLFAARRPANRAR